MNNSALIQETDRASKGNLRSAQSEGRNRGNAEIWLQLGFELGNCDWLNDDFWVLQPFDPVYHDSSNHLIVIYLRVHHLSSLEFVRCCKSRFT